MGWRARLNLRRWLAWLLVAAWVAAISLVVVVGGGALVGRLDRPSLLLSLVATAIVAMGIEPVRAALNRRLGLSAYDRLANLSAALATTVAIEEVALRLGRHLYEASGAAVAEVWLRPPGHPGEPEVAGRWPPTADPIRPAAPGVRRYPVRHDQEVLGWLVVRERPARPMEPVERRLVADLGAQAGLTLRHVALAADLHRQIAESERRAAELRASRQRIVAVADHERRRLERDIHDGAQQHLVAIAITCGMARSSLQSGPAGVLPVVSALRVAADRTLAVLEDLARGTYPPRLAELGVAAALRDVTKDSTPLVTVTDSTGRRPPPEVEVAAYFACLEAVQNAVKHAGARHVEVRIDRPADHLGLQIRDDGHGFDVAGHGAACGTANLRDRLDTVGGHAEVVSGPTGTLVRMWIPLAGSAGP